MGRRFEQRPEDLACLFEQAVAREARGADAVVMRPDRAEVVADRVVADRVARSDRMPQPLHMPPEVSTRATLAARSAEAIPAHKRVAGVRGDAIDTLLATVERERVGPDILHPELMLEGLAQLFRRLLLGARQSISPRSLASRATRATSRIDIALNLDQRDRAVGEMPSRLRIESHESFQP